MRPLQRLLSWWLAAVGRHPGPTLALCLLAAAGGLLYAVQTLGINTSTKDMLSETLPFRQNDRAMDRAFPRLEHEILVVVEAPTPEQAAEAAARLSERLSESSGRIRGLFYPDGHPFFRRNGLLYLDLEALEGLSDRLAAAQPLLAALNRDPSLRGLADLLERVSGEGGEAPPGSLSEALDGMADVVEARARGEPAILSWQGLLDGALAPGGGRKLIVVEPLLDFTGLQPAAPAIEEIGRVAAELGYGDGGTSGVRVRVTGNAAMLQDELESVKQGLGLVGLVSLILVTVLLAVGLESLRLVAATVVTLLVGLCWTGLFAAVAVGELNLISVTFAVLFIGLSVDFGIHYALRVKEERAAGLAPRDSLVAAGEQVGGALALTALAAAIGFLSFLPTAYRGLSELGLIAGAGMFIALFSNLTVLPAALALLPPAGKRAPRLRAGERLQAMIEARPGRIAVVAAILALASLAALPAARFDDDPLNLRDPESPSVATLLDVLDDPRVEPYRVSILAEDLAAADDLARRLRELEGVRAATTLSSFVPAEQDDKLAVIEDTALFLTPVFLADPVESPGEAGRAEAVARMIRTLKALPGARAGRAGARLAAALEDIGSEGAALAGLEQALLGTLPGSVEALAEALEAGAVGLEDLPAALGERYLAPDGQSLVTVHPEDDLRQRATRLAFVDAVSAVAPEATGVPVIVTAAGRAVIEAFLQAAGVALLLITLLLLLVLRSIRDSLLVLAPLMLAALLTVAATVVLALPFNFANVIVLPLLFGLGVASGIHMVIRHRREARGRVLHTSTPRAVLFSALTTIGSFGALALSAHRGTASMGELLTIAIALSLATSLVVLPALLALTDRQVRTVTNSG